MVKSLFSLIAGLAALVILFVNGCFEPLPAFIDTDIPAILDTSMDTQTETMDSDTTTATEVESSGDDPSDESNAVDTQSTDSNSAGDTIDSATAGSDTIDSATAGSDTVDSTTPDSDTVDSETFDGNTEDEAPVESSSDEVFTTDSDALGSDTVDSEAFGSDTVGGDTIDSESAPGPTDSDTAPESQLRVSLTLNPYAAVDWESWGQFKANLHTHTTNSDGAASPSDTIEQYHSKSYDVLAVTDHDEATWPWTDYGKNPAELGMVAVRGDEYSQSNHVNAFYNFSKTTSDMESGIPHVHAEGGLTQINHPGRYSYGPEDYLSLLNIFAGYSSCVLLEVFNTGDRYPNDRRLWDALNESLFPAYGRFVWGSSNDDKHNDLDLYRNFQFVLAPSLTDSDIEAALKNGTTYFAYEPKGSGDAEVPRILSIRIDEAEQTISVRATGYDTIRWIGPRTEEAGSSTVFNYAEYADKPFVRVVLDGPYGDSYSQPFGFETTRVPLDSDTSAGSSAP